MRKLILATAALAMGALIGADANAAVRAYWDQASGKWLKYDTEAQRVVPKNYTPIKRRVINYDGPFKANTLVINTAERRLYYVMPGGKALKYGVGVGKEGFQWSGTDYISRKAEWPGWTPPPEMIERERKKGRILPKYMEGGPRNPLGARALYIGGTLYRIHGSNEPWSIGRAVSSGCIRLTNDDVKHLYNQVSVGTRVVVLTGKESNARLAALANPPAKKKPVEEEAVEVASVDPTDEITPKDDDVVVVAPEEAAKPNGKDDDVLVMAPAPAEDAEEAEEARVKDDEVDEVAVQVDEEEVAAN